MMQFNPADSNKAKTLTRQQIEHFNLEGYIAPLALYDDHEATQQRDYLDGLLRQFLRDGRDPYDINEYHHLCQGIYDIVTHPRLLDYVEDLIGPDIVLWGSHYFCKMPGDKRTVPFHQDAVYWPFQPAKAVTAWIAIDEVHPQAGPMCFLPASHLQGRLEWQRRSEEVVLEKTSINSAMHTHSFSKPDSCRCILTCWCMALLQIHQAIVAADLRPDMSPAMSG